MKLERTFQFSTALFGIMPLLNVLFLVLSETPPPDAADALAIGLTHFQHAAGARQGLVPLVRI